MNVNELDLYDFSDLGLDSLNKVYITDDNKLIYNSTTNEKAKKEQAKFIFDKIKLCQEFIKRTNPSDKPDEKSPTYVSLLTAELGLLLESYFVTCFEYHFEMFKKQYGKSIHVELVKLDEYLTYIKKQAEPTDEKEKMLRLKNIKRAEAQLLSYENMIGLKKWTPPTFQDLKRQAVSTGLSYSDALKAFEQFGVDRLLMPSFIIEWAFKLYVDSGYDITLYNSKLESEYIKKAILECEKNFDYGNHFSKCISFLKSYWAQVTSGIREIEKSYVDSTINYFANNVFDIEAQPENIINSNVIEDDAMGGFSLKKAFKAIAKVTIKPVQKLTDSINDQFVKGLTKVLPDSIASKLANLSSASIQVLTLRLSSKTLRSVVEGVKDIGTFPTRAMREMTKGALTLGPVQLLDKYSGGLITSAYNLQDVSMKVADGRSNEIDWRMTAFDALKVGSAIAGGVVATSAMTATNAITTETGLNNSTAGKIVGAGVGLATGSSVSQVAVGVAQKEASRVATQQLLSKTALGNSSIGKSFVEIGVGATTSAIGSSNYSETVKATAMAKAKDVAKKRADQILKAETNGLISLSVMEKAYSIKDKNMEDMWLEFKGTADREVERLMSEGYLEEQARKEVDKGFLKLMDKAEGTIEKYGEDFLAYLVNKYGPQYDYDSFIQAEDFIKYQIVERKSFTYNTVIQKRNYAPLLAVGGGVIALAMANFL